MTRPSAQKKNKKGRFPGSIAAEETPFGIIGRGREQRPARPVRRRIRAHALPSARCRAMRGTPRAGGTPLRACPAVWRPAARRPGRMPRPPSRRLHADGAARRRRCRTAARGTHACPDVQCISAGSGCFAARGAVRRFDPFARRQLRPQRARTGCGRRRA